MFVCIAGKNDIAVTILQYLISNYQYELGVICNQTEKGEDGWQKSLRLFAQKQEIKEYLLEDVYPIKDMVFLSLEFDQLIKIEKFATDKLYNIHFSLLPKYRGMYTSALPILHGAHETGVTLHRIDNGIDTGEIIAQKKIVIHDTDTARDLYLQYINYGTALVLEHLESILSGNVQSVPQNEEEATYYSKHAIDYANLKIDFHKTAVEICRQVRAFSFREYQMPEAGGSKIIDAKITEQASNAEPGSILSENDNELYISSLDYDLILYKDRFAELMDACRQGDLHKVKEMKKIEKYLREVDGCANTPLIAAMQAGNLEMVSYLSNYLPNKA